MSDNVIWGVDFGSKREAEFSQLANELMMDAAMFGVSVTHMDENGTVSRIDPRDVFLAPDDDCA